MGKKNKNKDARREEDDDTKDEEDTKPKEYVDSSDEEPKIRQNYDIEPEIQELAYQFGIDDALTQRLNDVMIEERRKTWKGDLEKLYDVLKDADRPAALLNLKVRDMENGKFAGKAKCGPKVQALARKHRLDRGASTKLEDAMSIREAMGKDIDKDLAMLDEHLAASNKPSALVSQRLASLRKGYNIGHCIYSQNQIVNSNDQAAKFSDRDLEKRQQDTRAVNAISGAGGKLMSEAEIKKMMAAERKQDEAKGREEEKKRKKRQDSRSRSRSRNKRRKGSKSRRRDASEKKRRKGSKSRGRDLSEKRRRKGSRSRSRGRNRSKSKKNSGGKKDQTGSPSRKKDERASPSPLRNRPQKGSK